MKSAASGRGGWLFCARVHADAGADVERGELRMAEQGKGGKCRRVRRRVLFILTFHQPARRNAATRLAPLRRDAAAVC